MQFSHHIQINANKKVHDVILDPWFSGLEMQLVWGNLSLILRSAVCFSCGSRGRCEKFAGLGAECSSPDGLPGGTGPRGPTHPQTLRSEALWGSVAAGARSLEPHDQSRLISDSSAALGLSPPPLRRSSSVPSLGTGQSGISCLASETLGAERVDYLSLLFKQNVICNVSFGYKEKSSKKPLRLKVAKEEIPEKNAPDQIKGLWP